MYKLIKEKEICSHDGIWQLWHSFLKHYKTAIIQPGDESEIGC